MSAWNHPDHQEGVDNLYLGRGRFACHVTCFTVVPQEAVQFYTQLQQGQGTLLPLGIYVDRFVLLLKGVIRDKQNVDHTPSGSRTRR